LTRLVVGAIISPALNSLSYYVQPPNSGHKYRPMSSVPTVSNCLTSVIASRISSPAKQLFRLAAIIG